MCAWCIEHSTKNPSQRSSSWMTQHSPKNSNSFHLLIFYLVNFHQALAEWTTVISDVSDYRTNTWCESLSQPLEMFDHSYCQVLELLLDEVFQDSCIWSWFASSARTVCPTEGAPQTHVYNLSPYGVFLQACSSLNYLPLSQSWGSSGPIKILPYSPLACTELLKPNMHLCSSYTRVYFFYSIVCLCKRINCTLIKQILHFSFAGEVYILASSKNMAQSHSGKLFKLVDPKRYDQKILWK